MIDHEKLRKLAEAATKGHAGDGTYSVFMQEVRPATILALLDEMEGLEAECAAAHETAHNAVLIVEQATASTLKSLTEDADMVMRAQREIILAKDAHIARLEELLREAAQTARGVLDAHPTDLDELELLAANIDATLGGIHGR